MGRTVKHFCCNLLLQTLECYRKCSHTRLACFVFETNQHFVGSARIAGLCFKSHNPHASLWTSSLVGERAKKSKGEKERRDGEGWGRTGRGKGKGAPPRPLPQSTLGSFRSPFFSFALFPTAEPVHRLYQRTLFIQLIQSCFHVARFLPIA